FYDALRQARLAAWFIHSFLGPAVDRLETRIARRSRPANQPGIGKQPIPWGFYLLGLLTGCGLVYGVYRALLMLLLVPLGEWRELGVGLATTFLRVLAALVIALAWTVPVGVLIGSKARLSVWLQPIVQILASVPATALFPVFLVLLIRLPGGLNIAAVLLMLMGTQWYLLFNVISGVSTIPQDLKYTSALLQLSPWERWRILILPALFPYVITGAITASGGAWNASIIAEYVKLGGDTLHTAGVGSLIARATAGGDYPLLLAATLSLVLTVVMINRLVWRRLYRLAEERYRLE
ncbi:MAG TPA: ABC transporter permease subunit, partial [Syntrophobacteria bacterium]|nr:ABC transporter permease subunit [Syntrophobacteria bacterium]